MDHRLLPCPSFLPLLTLSFLSSRPYTGDVPFRTYYEFEGYNVDTNYPRAAFSRRFSTSLRDFLARVALSWTLDNLFKEVNRSNGVHPSRNQQSSRNVLEATAAIPHALR